MKVFITGVSSKIGMALAHELLRQDHEVWGVARTKDFLKEFLSKQKMDEHFSYSVCDITKSEDIIRVGEEMMEAKFLPDTVIFGSGILEFDIIPEFNYEAFVRMHLTNCLGALSWVNWFLPYFKKRGHGVFVAIASTQIFHSNNMSAGYAASKVALAIAFRNLRIRYAQENIFFTNVYFGPVITKKNPIKKNFFVQEPRSVVPCIIRALSGRRAGYYKPFFLKPILVLSLLFPDRFMITILEYLRRE